VATGTERLSLLWHDEFDGPAGTPPDAARWGYELGDGSAIGLPGWGNAELQHYTDEPANASLDGHGNLVVTARKDASGRYTSARLLTRDTFTFTYGRIETRLRVPRGAGVWPALWTLGSDHRDVGWPACGEIDVMEHVGREPRRLYATLHGPGYCGDSGYGGTLDLAHDVGDDFLVHQVDWSPEAIEWRADGVLYQRATPAAVAPDPWVFDHAFYLVVNLAVGGHFAGPIAPKTDFPQSLLVDYVRVFAAR
jgi:beta-glucanase (GH16 family)